MIMLARTPRKRAAGFTLIELMIAIAIIGVLAAIAVPAFSNYLARARVSEAIQYAESCKTGYVEFYATKGTLPASTTEANCPSVKTDNVESVSIVGGTKPAIQVVLTTDSVLPKAIQGNVIFLQPLGPSTTANGTTTPNLLTQGQTIGSWQCSLASAKAGTAATAAALDLVPAICRNTAL